MTWADGTEELEDAVEQTEHPKAWVLVVRVAISAGLLAILFWEIRGEFEWSELFPEWRISSVFWLGGAAGILFLGYFLSTVRWQQVILALDLRERLGRLFSHYLAGQFLSTVLPGTVGGDVLRMTRLTRDVHSGPASFASVVLERLTGWLVLPTITLLGFLLNPSLRHLGNRTRVALAIAAATLMGLILILFAVDHPRLGGRFAESHGWRRFAAAIHLGVGRLRHHPRAAGNVLGIGFIYGMSLIVATLMAAKALGIDNLGITALMAFFPAVLIAQVLPLTIGGLGVREGALVFFLSSVGIGKQEAIALGLLFYALTIVTSLSGAPSFAIGNRRLRRGPSKAVT